VKPEDASLELLIRVLGSEYGTISAAINELARRREAAIPTLVEAMRSGDSILRRRILKTFHRMRPAPDPGSTIYGIADILTDPDEEVRRQALWLLRYFGPKAKSVVPKMAEVLRDPRSDSDLRWCAIHVLHGVGPDARGAMGELVKALDHEDASVRNESIRAIMSVGDPIDESLIPRMIELLEDDKTTSSATAALIARGEVAVSSVRALLNDASPRSRKSSLHILAGMGQEAREALPAALKMLTDGNPEVCVYACLTVIKIAPPGKAEREKLLEFRNDREFESRQLAIECWRKLTPIGVDAIPGLVNALEDERSGVRIESAMVLEALGSRARMALPALKAARIVEEDGSALAAIYNAIIRILGVETDHHDWSMIYGGYRNDTWDVLCVHPPIFSDIDDREIRLPLTRTFLMSVSKERIAETRKRLRDAEPSAGALLPVYVRALISEDYNTRREACAVVIAMDVPGGGIGLDELSEFLNDPEFQAHKSLIKYWSNTNTKHIRSLQCLANALKDSRPTVRFAAANVLGAMGPAARDALPALKIAIHNDINGEVRGAMREALSSIRARAIDQD